MGFGATTCDRTGSCQNTNYYYFSFLLGCSNVGGRCSNSHTGHGYELKCQQTYRTHKLFSVAPNANKFDLVEVTFPSCCKCTHVRVAP